MHTIYILDEHKLFSGGLKLLLSSLPSGVECHSFEDADLFLDAITNDTGKLAGLTNLFS